ncbi:MAG: hypothetical protein ACOC0X_03695 [Halobacteriota archaeon]
MGKVSIGLRGWRFDETDVFTDDGELRSLEEMPPDVRNRINRLSNLVDAPCDCCWLIHGDENIRQCNVAEVVYGEPTAEVVVCGEHEADLLYWYRERGGADHRGAPSFRDAFHEWFADGGRAPPGYGPDEHVETEPEALPSFGPVGEMEPEITPEELGLERDRVDLRALKRDE